jgi:hypothetical protein
MAFLRKHELHSFQIEECDENFIKECYIEYKDHAFNETIEVCNEVPQRDCDQPGLCKQQLFLFETFCLKITQPLIIVGPIVCETVYESECATTYHVHAVEDDVPKCRIMQVFVVFC